MKLAQTILVYFAALVLAFVAFRISPFENLMPPWETWFDSLGLFWSMTLSCSITLMAMLTPSAVVTGFFQRYSYGTGLISTSLLTFIGLLTYYLAAEGGPDYTFQILVPIIVAIIVSLPFSIGYLLKTEN